ncbi:MAG TPA: hypothetical protein VD926_15620 [Acidimicrobiales bacterium]|nr:hypothetical protein [Acidimicrobiales bacterium]
MAEGRRGPFGAGRALAEGVVHQIVNGVVRELDVNAVVEKVDVDALLARIDVDAIIDRVDVDAIVKRVDVAAILEEVGVDDLVRQSTGVLASDTTRLVRIRTMNADVLLTRFVDRVLRRPSRFEPL